MTLLQIRNLSDDVYTALRAAAQAENRTVPQQTVVLLRAALQVDDDRARRRRVLDRLDRLQVEAPDSLADPATLIREDRDR